MATFSRVKTADGSDTVFHPIVGEHYHSIHGAQTESEHVFLNSGLIPLFEAKGLDRGRVLEVGFGTGLNAWLTAQLAENRSWKLEYWGLEPLPLPAEMLYPKLASDSNWELLMKHWPDIQQLSIGENVSLNVLKVGLEASLSYSVPVDVIYYDAFSPTHQPEMWTTERLRFLSPWTKLGTVLVTYCIRGHIRRSLHELGWTTKKMPGAPGKREMLWAEKTA